MCGRPADRSADDCAETCPSIRLKAGDMSMLLDTYALTRQLRRMGLYAPLYRAAQLFRSNDRAGRAELECWRGDLARMCQGLRRAAALAPKRVLVSGWLTFGTAVTQLPIVAGFIRAGYRPVVVLPSRADSLAIELYGTAGVDDFAFWTELPGSRRTVTEADIAAVRTVEDVLTVERDGIRTGRYAVSTMMRNLRRGRFDFSDAADRQRLLSWLQRSEDAISFAEGLLAEWRPNALLLNDQGYIPLGPLFERATQRGIAAYTWNASHRDNAIILKRYDARNFDEHPVSLSKQSWDAILARPWSDGEWQRLRDEIVHCYRSGQWYGEVGTQFDKTFPDRQTLVGRLGLDPLRRTVLVFPHIFWDGTFFWGRDLFADYEAFFTETMKVAYRTPTVNWIVKVHPANLVKNRRDGVDGPLGEWQVLQSLGPLPPHIRVLDASTDISTLSLFEVGDVCVTVRGTVGLEAACLGLTTVTAGTGRYDHLGFTIDPETSEEFLRTIASAATLAKPTAEAIDNARRYAHGILLERPTPYSSIRFGYAKDSVASLRVEFDDGAPLLESADVGAMADYIRSGATDFLQSP